MFKRIYLSRSLSSTCSMEMSRRDGVMPAEMNLVRGSPGCRENEVFAVAIIT